MNYVSKFPVNNGNETCIVDCNYNDNAVEIRITDNLNSKIHYDSLTLSTKEALDLKKALDFVLRQV